MKKFINNRIIAFVVYLILFLFILYLGNEQDSLLRFVLLSFYCVLVVNIQSKTRVVNNKLSWIVSMFIFSPIAFPLFLISDKKHFNKILILGIINIILWTILIYFSQQRFKLKEAFLSWNKSNSELIEIDKKYSSIDFENLNKESNDLIINLSENKVDELNKISDSIKTIRASDFVKLSKEQTEYYRKWSENINIEITATIMYVHVYEAIKEGKTIDTIDKLTTEWKLKNDELNSIKIKNLATKRIILYIFESINQMSVLFSIAVLLLFSNIFVCIKLFGYKSWKVWLVLGLITIFNLFMFDIQYWIG